jgi:hydrogenase maturation protein HypF
MLNIISLEYHETLMAGSGRQAEEALRQTVDKYSNKYVCIVEGSIPTRDKGVYMKLAGRPAMEVLADVAGKAGAIIVGAAIRAMLECGINAPLSSSVGRLFDAAAYLSGVAKRKRFEGQAAMCLERAIGDIRATESYKIESQNGIGDWAPLIEALLLDAQADLDVGRIAAKFHNALANWIVAVAHTTDVRNVVLSGGVFQNAYLTARTRMLLEEQGFRVFTHHQVPANDGGISLGQAVLAGQFES